MDAGSSSTSSPCGEAAERACDGLSESSEHKAASGIVRRPLLRSRKKPIRPLRFCTGQVGEAAAKTLLSAPGKSGGRFSLRLIMWIMLVVGAVAVVEQVVRQCWVMPVSGLSVSSYWGNAVESLGSSARLPSGLREVIPAYLPDLEVLPSGVIDCVQRQLDTSGKLGLPVEVENSIGMRFRLVPAGECLIGSPVTEVGHSVVESRHQQYFLEPFYLGKTEVTQGQWESVMGEGSNPSHFRGDDLPVEEVSWLQCQEFVRRLNEREGLPAHTYRLPSEAEWEYACRGGSESGYCFGDDVSRLDEWADYVDNNGKGPGKVGQKRPNSLGLQDMHGNVWEWCRTYYRNYPGDSTPVSSAQRCRSIRGGNWYVSALQCRSANRCRLPDRSAGNMLGFRVMRVVPPES